MLIDIVLNSQFLKNIDKRGNPQDHGPTTLRISDEKVETAEAERLWWATGVATNGKKLVLPRSLLPMDAATVIGRFLAPGAPPEAARRRGPALAGGSASLTVYARLPSSCYRSAPAVAPTVMPVLGISELFPDRVLWRRRWW